MSQMLPPQRAQMQVAHSMTASQHVTKLSLGCLALQVKKHNAVQDTGSDSLRSTVDTYPTFQPAAQNPTCLHPTFLRQAHHLHTAQTAQPSTKAELHQDIPTKLLLLLPSSSCCLRIVHDYTLSHCTLKHKRNI